VPFVKPFPSPFPPDLLATPVVVDLFEAEGFDKIFPPTFVPLAKLVDFRSLLPVDADERLKEEALFVAGLCSVAFVSVICFLCIASVDVGLGIAEVDVFPLTSFSPVPESFLV
jgi:hypothetical protein